MKMGSMVVHLHYEGNRRKFEMKKLLAVLCAAFVLAGCGGGDKQENVVKKTCSMEQEGIAVVMDMEGKDDVLTKVAMNVSASYDAMAAQGLSKDMIDSLDEDKKKEAADVMKKTMLEAVDLDEDDGYTITSEFDDEGWKMTISAEASIFEQTFNASSLDDMVKEMTEAGFTCK